MIPDAQIPLVLVVMNLSYALSAYPVGVLSDRVNRKMLLLVAECCHLSGTGDRPRPLAGLAAGGRFRSVFGYDPMRAISNGSGSGAGASAGAGLWISELIDRDCLAACEPVGRMVVADCESRGCFCRGGDRIFARFDLWQLK